MGTMNNANAKFSEVVVVNNTQNDLPTSWWVEIIDSLKANGTLPETVTDLFVVSTVEVEDGTRFVLNAA
jgi:hypothetical protein